VTSFHSGLPLAPSAGVLLPGLLDVGPPAEVPEVALQSIRCAAREAAAVMGFGCGLQFGGGAEGLETKDEVMLPLRLVAGVG
jgi:hypothetical protein